MAHTTKETNRNVRARTVPTYGRSMAEIEAELMEARAKRAALEARILNLQDEAYERITGHKKRGRKRKESGVYPALGDA